MPASISVVVPFYNASEYLGETLQSLFAQTLAPAEVILVNDGSTDNFLPVLEPYQAQITLLSRQENRGLSVTINEGIKAATGSYLAMLDADDLWHPEKLALQHDFLQANPAVSICFSYVQQFISPELPPLVKDGIACPTTPQPGYLKIAMMARRSVFEQVGLFDESIQNSDFIEWFGRAKALGLTYQVLPQTLAYRRLHRSGMSSNYQYKQEMLQAIKKIMSFKRAGQ